MKKTFLLLAGACVFVSFVSCTKAGKDFMAGSEKITLAVSVNSASTKASAETLYDEAEVKTLQVFVFNGDMLDSYGIDSKGSKTVTVTSTTGDRNIYALVNAPDLGDITTMSSLKATVSRLADNTSDAFVMCGNSSVALTASSEVSVNVSRLASRLRIKKITRKMTASGLADISADKFELTRVYVCDAVTNNNYALSLTGGYIWKSSTLAEGTDAGKIATGDPFLYNKPSVSLKMEQNGSVTPDFLFYVYPNATTAESSSARFTRMVIECRIDGKYYTYPIVIEQPIASSKSYELGELVITRLGIPSNGDDVIDPGETEKIIISDVPFGITVHDWDLVLLGSDGTVVI